MRTPLQLLLLLAATAVLPGCDQGGRELTWAAPADSAAAQNFTIDQARIVKRTLAQQRNINEWTQDDALGAFDDLIPVSADYPLPEVPSRRHDVATVRNANYLRPMIPALRTTADGRVGIAPTGGELSDGVDPLRFMLLTPEKLDRHFSLASDGSQDFVAEKVWEIPFDAVLENGDHL